MSPRRLKDDPPPLRDPTKGRGALILAVQNCKGCGYSLKGLALGGACPECGRTIASRGHRTNNSLLSEAPEGYLQILGLGALMMAVGGVVNFFNAVPWIWASSSKATGGAPAGAVALIHIMAAVAWTTGCLIVLRSRPSGAAEPSPDDPLRPEWFHLRMAAGATQLAWPVVASLRFLEYSKGGAFFEWTSYIFVIIGAAGWAAVAGHMYLLADWGRDDGLTGRLRAASWGFAILGLGMLGLIHFGALDLGWTNLIFLFSGLVVIGWLASYVFLVLGALQLNMLCRWAIVNAEDVESRDQRRAAKTRADAERRLREEREFGPGYEPDPHALREFESAQANAQPSAPSSDGPLPGKSMPRIDQAKDATPYRIEGDPELRPDP